MFQTEMKSYDDNIYYLYLTCDQAHVQCCCVCTEHRQESAQAKLDATCVFDSQGGRKMKIFVFSVYV